MKVIDLLNKIANGEIEPNTEFFCKKEKYRHIDSLFGDYYVEEVLNEEVEIIEEDKKIPKKITMRAGMVGSIDNKLENLNINIMAVEDKINEIIEYLEDKQ